MAAHKNVKGEKKWWYDLGALGIVCLFFLVLDYYSTGRVSWSVYPIAAVVFFVGGFKLLDTFGRN